MESALSDAGERARDGALRVDGNPEADRGERQLEQGGLEHGREEVRASELERDVEPGVDAEQRAGRRCHGPQPRRAAELADRRGKQGGCKGCVEAGPDRLPVLRLVTGGEPECQPHRPRDEHEPREREERRDQAWQRPHGRTLDFDRAPDDRAGDGDDACQRGVERKPGTGYEVAQPGVTAWNNAEYCRAFVRRSPPCPPSATSTTSMNRPTAGASCSAARGSASPR